MSKIAQAAKKWVGKDFHPGQGEQCMAFVRQVLDEADSPIRDAVTADPVDNKAHGLGTSFFLASSLAGRDLGEMVDKIANLKPGAIVFFDDTYGNYPTGTITHVGVFVGNGKMVHRPTKARPVEEVDLTPGSYWAGFFRAGLLTEDLAAPKVDKDSTIHRAKIYAKPGSCVAYRDGVSQKALTARVDYQSGKLSLAINGMVLPLDTIESVSLEVAYKAKK